MSKDKWLDKELELAGASEDGYGKAVLNSAAKAYLSLLDDEHSGASIGFTKHILNRLIEHKPLTPLTGQDDEWNLTYREDDEYNCYQNKRCSSVFKNVYDNGNITYNDINRFVCEDFNNGSRFTSGSVVNVVKDYFPPIVMPYIPADKPIVIMTEDFLIDESHGDFDTRGIFYAITPDGDKIDINKYQTEVDNVMVEMEVEEYMKQRGLHMTKTLTHSDKLIVKDSGEISDGYHTFNELYYHRMTLFSIICNTYQPVAWKSWKHDDNTMYDDMFIVGVTLPTGDYSYHYNKEHWDKFDVRELAKAPKWDGHKPEDIDRLECLVK